MNVSRVGPVCISPLNRDTVIRRAVSKLKTGYVVSYGL